MKFTIIYWSITVVVAAAIGIMLGREVGFVTLLVSHLFWAHKIHIPRLNKYWHTVWHNEHTRVERAWANRNRFAKHIAIIAQQGLKWPKRDAYAPDAVSREVVKLCNNMRAQLDDLPREHEEAHLAPWNQPNFIPAVNGMGIDESGVQYNDPSLTKEQLNTMFPGDSSIDP